MNTKTKVIIGVVALAAAIGGFLFWKHHKSKKKSTPESDGTALAKHAAGSGGAKKSADGYSADAMPAPRHIHHHEGHQGHSGMWHPGQPFQPGHRRPTK